MKNLVKKAGILIILMVIWVVLISCADDNEPPAEDPVLTGTVSITGITGMTAKVGQKLTANTSKLGGTGDISYMWMRSSGEEGETETGINSNSYIIQSVDVGKNIFVIVSRNGYSGSISNGFGIYITDELNLPKLTGSVSITGTAKVDQTLTANTSKLNGTGDISYKWMRGEEIIGSDSKTYTIHFSDIGSVITVIVSRNGYSGSIKSLPTATIESNESSTMGLLFTLQYNNEYSVSKGTATDAEVIIPAKYNGLPVTAIEKQGFEQYSIMTSIIIPDSVTVIGYDAFSDCSSLTSITIPNSVKSIGIGAFGNCSSLTSITIPDSVTRIGAYAFVNCINLTSITIPDSVTSIGDFAFSSCSSLTSITIPDSVTSIDFGAFAHCSSLMSITIPNSVKSIGSNAFLKCINLTSITIPDSVTSIGDFAFAECSSLTSITIPNSVKSIDYGAFLYCTRLTSITIPFVGLNRTPLDNYNNTHFGFIFGLNRGEYFTSFYPLLKTVVITGGTRIERDAFYGCNDLSITIPNSVTDIYSTFERCTNLSILWHYNTSSVATTIFYKYLKTVIIPDGVTSIRYNAFRDCNNLTSITIPDSVTSINQGAFAGCTSLTSITIPDSVTSIGQDAFSDCTGLTSITIPSSVTSIGNSSFSGCTGLTSITIPSSVTRIGDSSFSGCTGLTSITIPSSVTRIGDSSFSGCSGLTSVTIPSSVTSIGSRAFLNCNNLTSITIPSNVISINEGAFAGCTSLTSITIPSSVTSIGDYAFSGCTGLTSITIPSSVTSIGDYAFRGCSGLTSVTIPSSVTRIGYFAFSDCSVLTSITIPSSVTRIDDTMFSVRTDLRTIYYGGANISAWNAICTSYNTYLNNTTRYYYSETYPGTAYTHWRYVDGVPTVWY